jgi:hypothetical protein
MFQFHAWPFPPWFSDTKDTAEFLRSAKGSDDLPRQPKAVRVFTYHHVTQFYAGPNFDV